MTEEEYLQLRIDLAKAELAVEQEERRAREKQSSQRVAKLRERLAEAEGARRGGAALLAMARGLRPQVLKNAEAAFGLRLKIAVTAGQLAEAERIGDRARKEDLTAVIGGLLASLAKPHGVGRDCEAQLGVEVQRLGMKDTTDAAEARALAGLADPRWELPGDEVPEAVRNVVGWGVGEQGKYHHP